MRTFAVMYDARTSKGIVIFRDDYDPPDKWYAFMDIPPFDNPKAAHTIVTALNAMQGTV